LQLQGVAKKQRPTKITDAVKNGGFVKYEREALPYRPAAERLKDWGEVLAHGNQDALLKTQSARCMDCGTPFCQQVQLGLSGLQKSSLFYFAINLPFCNFSQRVTFYVC
jgi:hypothetical protein